MFEKIDVMPKGQQRNIKRSICNFPVDCDQTSNVLPRYPKRSGIVMLKLKRKFSFKGRVYFQALNWLRINNLLHSGKLITVNATNIDENLSQLHLKINSDKDSEVCPVSDKIVNREQLMMNTRKKERILWMNSEHPLQKLARSQFYQIILIH